MSASAYPKDRRLLIEEFRKIVSQPDFQRNVALVQAMLSGKSKDEQTPSDCKARTNSDRRQN